MALYNTKIFYHNRTKPILRLPSLLRNIFLFNLQLPQVSRLPYFLLGFLFFVASSVLLIE